MSKIGFIGLGLMGGAMVSRLQDKGHSLEIMGNRDRTHLNAAIARGAHEASTARELTETVDVVMLCMGTSEHVESRMRGGDGVIAGLSEGKVVIDFGTSLPASTIALGAEVADAGGQFLDAPLGRTPAHAVDGLLNIMCAGDKAAFDKVKPVLDDLGENVFHLGPIGTGHTIKLINNFFGMTIANAMAEAYAMADIAGVPRKATYDVISAGPNHSGMMDFVSGYALDGDPSKLAFSIRNAAKDIGYYAQMAKANGTETVMAKSTLQALTDARDKGHGDEMVSQIVDYYAARFKEGV